MKQVHWIIVTSLTILLTALAGCRTVPSGQPDLQENLASFSKTWEVTGLKGPESALYDSKRDVIYVSNVNGKPTEKNGAGFISTVGTNGQVKELEWLTGLNAPKGMGLHGKMLYISDLDQVVEVDVESKAIIKRYPVPNAKFLNDVTVDASGNVYISDMGDNAIYRIAEGKLELWVQDADLEFPNGLFAEENRLVVVSWGVITDSETFSTDVSGHVHTISFSDKSVASQGDAQPLGNLDGVEADGQGGYFISDWVAGKIYSFDSNGGTSVILTLKSGSADIGYIPAQKLLLIPMMKDGELAAYSVK